MRKHYLRFLARWMPLTFVRWVMKHDRCWIDIHGEGLDNGNMKWLVQVGVHEGYEFSLGKAMLKVLTKLEDDPEWKWLSDYLKEL